MPELPVQSYFTKQRHAIIQWYLHNTTRPFVAKFEKYASDPMLQGEVADEMKVRDFTIHHMAAWRKYQGNLDKYILELRRLVFRGDAIVQRDGSERSRYMQKALAKIYFTYCLAYVDLCLRNNGEECILDTRNGPRWTAIKQLITLCDTKLNARSTIYPQLSRWVHITARNWLYGMNHMTRLEMVFHMGDKECLDHMSMKPVQFYIAVEVRDNLDGFCKDARNTDLPGDLVPLVTLEEIKTKWAELVRRHSMDLDKLVASIRTINDILCTIPGIHEGRKAVTRKWIQAIYTCQCLGRAELCFLRVCNTSIWDIRYKPMEQLEKLYNDQLLSPEHEHRRLTEFVGIVVGRVFTYQASPLYLNYLVDEFHFKSQNELLDILMSVGPYEECELNPIMIPTGPGETLGEGPVELVPNDAFSIEPFDDLDGPDLDLSRAELDKESDSSSDDDFDESVLHGFDKSVLHGFDESDLHGFDENGDGNPDTLQATGHNPSGLGPNRIYLGSATSIPHPGRPYHSSTRPRPRIPRKHLAALSLM